MAQTPTPWDMDGGNKVSDYQVQSPEYPPKSCAALLQSGDQPGSEFHPDNDAGLSVQKLGLSLTYNKIHVMVLNL